MDLDGDRIKDVISGSWPGEIYFFKGIRGGAFANAETLKHEDGKNINVGNASAVAVTDWNGNGKLDLVIGTIDGDVYFVPQSGSSKLTFGKQEQIHAGGKPINIHDGGPFIFDWDTDGIHDLIIGGDDGSVTFFKASKSNGKTTLAEGVILIEPLKEEAYSGFKVNPKTKELINGRSGSRAKICVADWNNDGKTDLIVGDFSFIQPEPKNLTFEEEKRRDEIKKLLNESHQKYQKLYEKYEKLTKEKLGYGVDDENITQEKLNKFYETMLSMMEQDKEYQEYEKQYSALYEELAKYEDRPTMHGWVWVYLRK